MTNCKVDKVRATQQLVDALVFRENDVWTNFGQPSNCWDYSVLQSKKQNYVLISRGTSDGMSVDLSGTSRFFGPCH